MSEKIPPSNGSKEYESSDESSGDESTLRTRPRNPVCLFYRFQRRPPVQGASNGTSSSESTSPQVLPSSSHQRETGIGVAGPNAAASNLVSVGESTEEKEASVDKSGTPTSGPSEASVLGTVASVLSATPVTSTVSLSLSPTHSTRCEPSSSSSHSACPLGEKREIESGKDESEKGEQDSNADGVKKRRRSSESDDNKDSE